MITLLGDRMSSRVSASLLTSAGLPELICGSTEEYEELAVTLAEDSEKLFSCRRKLERCRDSCAAFDTARWVRNLEAGFNEAIRKLESNEAPDDITITDSDPVAIEKDESLLGSTGGGSLLN